MQSHRAHGSSVAAAPAWAVVSTQMAPAQDTATTLPRAVGDRASPEEDSEGCRSAPLYSAGEEPTPMAKHPRRIWLPSMRRTARGRGGEDAEVLLRGGDRLPPRGHWRRTASSLAGVGVRGGLEGGGKSVVCGKWNQVRRALCVDFALHFLFLFWTILTKPSVATIDRTESLAIPALPPNSFSFILP